VGDVVPVRFGTVSTPRTKVAVIFGGRSNEHAVSCVSAGSVLKHLDPQRYEVVPIGITTDGAWVLGASDLDALAIHGRELPSVDKSGAGTDGRPDPPRRAGRAG
jgi:D-alanine-D-alanine ligase